jgi:hypothetical protein
MIKDWAAWIIIGLAFAGIVYAGPMQEAGAGNPRPKEYLELEQYKKDLAMLAKNLDAKFAEIEKKIK